MIKKEQHGFIFYPKDWWTSDTFFELDAIERYVYLEMLFMTYQNKGFLKPNINKIKTQLRIEINPTMWERITQTFISTPLGLTHPSVTKRLGRVVTNRLNGIQGGRPSKEIEDDQKNPNETQSAHKRKEKKIKENKIKKEKKDLVLSGLNNDKIDPFNEWLDYRVKIKKPISNLTTLKALVKRFNKTEIVELKEAVGQSIENGWQGLFFNKNIKKNKTGLPSTSAIDNLNTKLGL